MRKTIVILVVLNLMVTCNHSGNDYTWQNEDKDAKQMLQGVWVNDDEGSPAFLAKGDSIVYPDTASLSAKFWIYQDSLYLEGKTVNRYKITKQAEHLFKFLNQSGEEVKLVKSDDKGVLPLFYQYRPYAMNIFRTIDVDTIGKVEQAEYRCMIHMETTSDRIIKTSHNVEGIEVENMYLDNLARVELMRNGIGYYQHEFRKQEFSAFVPRDFLEKSIVRNVYYNKVDSTAVYLDAVIGIPDASSCYVVELKINRNGKLFKRLK